VKNRRPLGFDVLNLREISSASVIDSCGNVISRYWLPSKDKVRTAVKKVAQFTEN